MQHSTSIVAKMARSYAPEFRVWLAIAKVPVLRNTFLLRLVRKNASAPRADTDHPEAQWRH